MVFEKWSTVVEDFLSHRALSLHVRTSHTGGRVLCVADAAGKGVAVHCSSSLGRIGLSKSKSMTKDHKRGEDRDVYRE